MNGFVPNYIEEIKRRLNVVDFISARVSLKKSGKNYKGLCPFHSERSGSFFVFPQTESYYCFGCHETGDIFTFAMKTEGLEFGEALEMLAKRTGVVLPEREDKPAENAEITAQKERKERLREVNAAAATYFSHLLLKANEGQAAREYLKKRGITPASVESFGLGYALDSWEALLNHLTEHNRFTRDELVQAGLVGERENGEGYYDRFRGRLIYPIRDRQGQIIAFGGRVLEGAPKDAPKYLNSPQTVLFDKSATLYGFDLARDGIRRNDCAVVVEGYMDVIVAHQNGFTNVVAPLGTALNEKHVASLKKLTKRIVLALDADAAGQKATLHGIEVLKKGFDTFSVAIPNARGLVQFEQQLDADIRIAVLPEGKDPDEVIREDGKTWQTLVDKALPVVDYTFALAASSADLTTARGKSETVETLMPLIVEVRDRIAREHYIQRLSKLTQIAPDLLHSELRRTSNRQVSRPSNPESTSDVNSIEESETVKPIIQIGTKRGLDIEDKILAFLLRYPAGFVIAGQDGNTISSKDFTRSENRQLFEAMLAARENNEPFTDLDEKLTPELVNHLSVLQEQIALQPELDPYVEVNQDMEFQLNRLRDSRTREIMEVLEDEINTESKESEEELSEEDNQEIWGKLNELAAQRKLYAPKPSAIFKDSRDR